jgi:hypothetical protein
MRYIEKIGIGYEVIFEGDVISSISSSRNGVVRYVRYRTSDGMSVRDSWRMVRASLCVNESIVKKARIESLSD